VGFAKPTRSPWPLVRSCRTVSPLPVAPPKEGLPIGGLFSVALSCESPRLAVNQHPALWSPDLPRPGHSTLAAPSRDHLACSLVAQLTATKTSLYRHRGIIDNAYRALRPGRTWACRVPNEPAHGAARDVLDVLRSNGATFASDLPELARRLPSDVEDGLWDLVARGIATSDGFGAVRSLFTPRSLAARRRLPGRRARLGLSLPPTASTRSARAVAGQAAGRCCLALWPAKAPRLTSWLSWSPANCSRAGSSFSGTSPPTKAGP